MCKFIQFNTRCTFNKYIAEYLNITQIPYRFFNKIYSLVILKIIIFDTYYTRIIL